MEKDIEKLQELTDRYDRIVFLEGRGYLRRAGFQIFGALMVCIIRSMSTRRKQF